MSIWDRTVAIDTLPAQKGIFAFRYATNPPPDRWIRLREGASSALGGLRTGARVVAFGSMEDTWAQRDRPVLEWLVQHFDENVVAIVEPHQVARALDLDEMSATRALAALYSAAPPYLLMYDERTQSDLVPYVRGVTERARRDVGAWPTAEALADRVIDGLKDAAAAEPDERKRGRLTEVAAYLGGAARDVLVDVAGTAVARSAGI